MFSKMIRHWLNLTKNSTVMDIKIRILLLELFTSEDIHQVVIMLLMVCLDTKNKEVMLD